MELFFNVLKNQTPKEIARQANNLCGRNSKPFQIVITLVAINIFYEISLYFSTLFDFAFKFLKLEHDNKYDCLVELYFCRFL